MTLIYSSPFMFARIDGYRRRETEKIALIIASGPYTAQDVLQKKYWLCWVYGIYALTAGKNNKSLKWWSCYTRFQTRQPTENKIHLIWHDMTTAESSQFPRYLARFFVCKMFWDIPTNNNNVIISEKNIWPQPSTKVSKSERTRKLLDNSMKQDNTETYCGKKIKFILLVVVIIAINNIHSQSDSCFLFVAITGQWETIIKSEILTFQ